MERISSLLFMLALLFYYIPKDLKIKKFNFRKVHIFIGSISIISMCIALLQRIGNYDFIKYIGFTLIMLFIGITGYISLSKRKVGIRLHIANTICFFIYLFLTIFVSRM